MLQTLFFVFQSDFWQRACLEGMMALSCSRQCTLDWFAFILKILFFQCFFFNSACLYRAGTPLNSNQRDCVEIFLQNIYIYRGLYKPPSSAGSTCVCVLGTVCSSGFSAAMWSWWRMSLSEQPGYSPEDLRIISQHLGSREKWKINLEQSWWEINVYTMKSWKIV